MTNYKKFSICFLATFLLLLSCTKGAVTPKGAFINVKNAYLRTDAKALQLSLSKASLQKIKKITTSFSTMNEEQILSLSKLYDVSPKKLKHISINYFLSIYLRYEKNKGTMIKAVNSEIINIAIEKRKAIVMLVNGINLEFVKEGPYWKFDMTRL